MSGDREDIYAELDGDDPCLGCLPDPPDERDLNFARLSLVRSVRDRATVEHLLHTPFDQGRLGSCVAQSVAQALHVSHAAQFAALGMTTPPKVASRLAIYYLARATHRMQHFDSGTFIRAAFQVLNKFGFAPEESWAYDVARFAVKPPFRTFALSFDQSGRRPAIYWRIYDDGAARIEQVKAAIANGHGVVFGADVGDKFKRHRGAGLVDPRSGGAVGGHAMLLCAYDADWCRLVNSWGTGWGDGGYANVPWEFVADGIRDVWVCEHAPSYA